MNNPGNQGSKASRGKDRPTAPPRKDTKRLAEVLPVLRALLQAVRGLIATLKTKAMPLLRRAQASPAGARLFKALHKTLQWGKKRLQPLLKAMNHLRQWALGLALTAGDMTLKELMLSLKTGVSRWMAGLKKQHLVAIGVLLALALWMLLMGGGAVISPSILTNSERPVVAIAADQPFGDNPDAVSVRAERITPQAYIERVRVRGRTRAYRHVEVRAEVAGRVSDEPIARGARVDKGDLLCQLAVDSREAELAEARSRHAQAEIEYQGALDLKTRGLQSEVELARMKTALDTATAALSRAELALEKTRIVAPFAGVVESREVEQGDVLSVGAVCASVLDDSPMLLVGLVPEQEIGGISLGNRVDAVLVDERALSGAVSYLARAADPVSRSYRIEAEVDAGYNTVRDGITAEMMVATAEVMAHLVPASALSFDDNGVIGVKTVADGGEVKFSPVRIIADNSGRLDPGVWVSGLQGSVTLITVGQEIVFPGQKVQTDFSWQRTNTEGITPLQPVEAMPKQ